jgi:hypothetical protein
MSYIAEIFVALPARMRLARATTESSSFRQITRYRHAVSQSVTIQTRSKNHWSEPRFQRSAAYALNLFKIRVIELRLACSALSEVL